ncbi:MAG: adenylate/guanylate cyclase domain-containing protein [Limnobacter sp.]|nr:adenylate/guanylate cyclase domain-containing protein [Limnobacter sp.]
MSPGFKSARRTAQKTALGLGAMLLAVALVWLVSLGRTWNTAEFRTFDLFTAWSASQLSNPTEDLPIVIVAIDEASFEELDMAWPFPRSLHGKLIERARADGAKAVVFDVIFSEPSSTEQDNAFAESIRGEMPVVLASTVERQVAGSHVLWSEVLPLDVLQAAGAMTGQAGVNPDDDFVVRRFEWSPQALAAKIAQIVMGQKGADETQAGLQKIPEGDFRLMRYLGAPGTFDTRSYYQAVIDGLLPAGFFKNKIVLVGRSTRTTEQLSGSRVDMFNSPFAVLGEGDRLFPGVEIQANLASNYVKGGIKLAPEYWQWLALVFSLMLFAPVAQKNHPALLVALALIFSLAYTGTSFYMFHRQSVWLSPLFFVAALLSATAAVMVTEFVYSRNQARAIRGMFAQYVPPEVVTKLVENPDLFKLGGENRELTLMFTDLADFTAMAEKLPPEATVEVLTEYFNTMTAIIHKYKGTVDKFIGDAIMAFWGAPLPDDNHAENAVLAARDMLAAMEEIKAKLKALDLPMIAMRIGLHTGNVVVGNIGSDSRFSYTAIGDAVNLASRLEGANKNYGTWLLVSESTKIKLPGHWILKPVDELTVKGKTEAVKVYTLA